MSNEKIDTSETLFSEQCYEVERCAELLAETARHKRRQAKAGPDELGFVPTRQDIQWMRSKRAELEALASEIRRYM